MKDFYELEEQYRAMIWKIIHSLNIYKYQDEFYQTGLIALWQASERFNCEKGSFTSYAYAYIRGRILTELTKRNHHEENCVIPDEEYWNLLQDNSSQIPLEKENLLTYCTDLTEHQKKWVLYTALADLSIREIAEVENVSVSAVKAWRKGARAKLIEKLKAKNT